MGQPPKDRNSGSASSRRITDSASKRYTPPEDTQRQWLPERAVPFLVFGLLGIGLLLILANYVGAVPGGNNNSFLIVGLGLILGGIIASTQWK